MRRKLTEELIAGLRPKVKRYLVYDTAVPQLAVRVGKRRKTYVVVARLRDSKATRHSLGSVSAISLADARKRALNFQRPSTVTFGDIAEQFIVRIQHQRRSRDVEGYIRRELLPRWRDRALSDITKRDVVDAVEAVVRRGKLAVAHHVFSAARLIFNYAIERDHIEHSPCDRLRPKTLIGPRVVRQRILNEDEIRAFYLAASSMPYPYGPCFLLLLMTAQRRNEITHARWSEIQDGVLVIPPERFKSNAIHRVPLPRAALDLIRQLPRHNEYLFARPLRLHKAKKRLVAKMPPIPPFRIHDLRRTVRTHMAALRVPDAVAEMILGHGPRGIERVYNVHRYEDEMRDALNLWCHRLSQILANQARMTSQK